VQRAGSGRWRAAPACGRALGGPYALVVGLVGSATTIFTLCVTRLTAGARRPGAVEILELQSVGLGRRPRPSRGTAVPRVNTGHAVVAESRVFLECTWNVRTTPGKSTSLLQTPLKALQLELCNSSAESTTCDRARDQIVEKGLNSVFLGNAFFLEKAM